MPYLHGEWLEITLTVPLNISDLLTEQNCWNQLSVHRNLARGGGLKCFYFWGVQHHSGPENPLETICFTDSSGEGCTSACTYCVWIGFYFLYLLNYRNISLMIKYEDGHCIQVKTSIRQVNIILKIPKIFFEKYFCCWIFLPCVYMYCTAGMKVDVSVVVQMNAPVFQL